jgi:FtsP/CotA-like multicopper oxidase with cupredoxin domain
VLLDPVTGAPSGATTRDDVVCRSVTCGDGHINMADGADTFIFGFHDVTNKPESGISAGGFWSNTVATLVAGSCTPTTPAGDPCTFTNQGALWSGICDGASPVNHCVPDGTLTGASEFSAPTLFAKAGQKLYLTLTNVGFRERPDLSDPHTIHFHGFPNAGSVFDGEPMASFGINPGSSLTYFYDNKYAGTYMWHCHVEAAEHMQMGMLGNLYVRPKQDDVTSVLYGGRGPYTRFAYDDCGDPADLTDPMCGSTGYDVTMPLQESAFDPVFHHNDQTYQKLPFANMFDTYPMFNGRGYPDTLDPNIILNSHNAPSQPLPAIPVVTLPSGDRDPIKLKTGQKLLVRLSSLATESFYTVTVLGIPMRVVGQGAQLLRGAPDSTGRGVNTSYLTGSVTLSGGEGLDVLLDTSGVPPGTYFLYTTNYHHLSNASEDFGGLMTELVVVK